MAATPNSPAPRGFPRWAWWTVLLSIFLFLVPLTSPWWSMILRSEISGGSDEDEEASPTPAPDLADEPVVPGSTLKLTLYVPNLEGEGVRAVEREVAYVRGFLPQIAAVVGELGVATPEAKALLPPGTRVLDTAYTPAGTVYVDFSAEIEAERRIGASEETALVQGIVTTIMENFSAVRRVVILVEGKIPSPGHLDLSRPFRLDDPLFRLEAEPAVSPSPTPSTLAPAPASVAPVAAPTGPRAASPAPTRP